MRRTDREVVDVGRIQAFVEGCKVCRLGLRDGDGAYIVPLSFGVEFSKGLPVFYFHCANAGHKLTLLDACPTACFELDGNYRVEPGAGPCQYSAGFMSVMGTGRVERLTQPEEKRRAFCYILFQQTGQTFSPEDIPQASLDGVTVLRLCAASLSCKERPWSS